MPTADFHRLCAGLSSLATLRDGKVCDLLVAALKPMTNGDIVLANPTPNLTLAVICRIKRLNTIFQPAGAGLTPLISHQMATSWFFGCGKRGSSFVLLKSSA